MLKILHVASKIQAFLLASFSLIFELSLRRSAKSQPSLVGVVRGLIGIRVRLPRYLVCSFMVVLRRQPKTMWESELCLGSQVVTFLKRRRYVSMI